MRTSLLVAASVLCLIAAPTPGSALQSGLVGSQLDTLKAELKQDFRTRMHEVHREIRDLAEENLALRKELDSLRAGSPSVSNIDKNEIMKLVSGVLDRHKRDLSERMERFEVNQEVNQEEKGISVAPRHRDGQGRRLDMQSSVLQDAALWMQAENAKMLFGSNADVNLYRSNAEELTTDTDLLVKRDLAVLGENWHLATMMEANENITVGDVISLCNGGKACKGYGIEDVGYFQTSQKSVDIGVIDLGGGPGANILYYRSNSATDGAQSQPIMRVMKPRHPVTGLYEADPLIGSEHNIGTEKVSHLAMAAITESEFVMCYRKEYLQVTDTNVQLGVRLGRIVNIDNNQLVAGDEIKIELYSGEFGAKRGIPIKLGSAKYAIVYETTDERDNAWLGTVQLAMGTLGGTSDGDFGLTIGGGQWITEYASDVSAVALNDLKHVVIAYRQRNAAGSSDQGWVRLVDTSESQAKPGTTLRFSPIQSRFMDLTMVSRKTVCLVYREPDLNFLAKGVLLTLNDLNTALAKATAVPVAPPSSIDNSYALSVSRLNDVQLVLTYRNSQGKPRIVDADVVGTTIVVGRPRKFKAVDHVADTYKIVGVGPHSFVLVYQDTEANNPHVATIIVGKTHGGALRTGVATANAFVGEEVQVAIEGAVTVPVGKVKVNGEGKSMTPGARYFAKYNGGISPSSEDGVLLGRALRGSLLLLERDFAGGFEINDQSASGGAGSAFAGEIRSLAGSTVPAGWLPCDGRAIDRIAYSSLFAAIGTTWGKGDETSTFNIPDLRGRTVLGQGKGAGGSKLSLTQAEADLAKPTQHDLGEYDGSEQFEMDFSCASGTATTNNGWTWNNFCTTASKLSLGTTTNSKSSTGSATSSADFDRINMMPYATVNYIIKT